VPGSENSEEGKKEYELSEVAPYRRGSPATNELKTGGGSAVDGGSNKGLRTSISKKNRAQTRNGEELVKKSGSHNSQEERR